MAPLAPSNTARFRVHYTTVGQDHTAQFRSGASPASFGSFYNAFASSLSAAIAPQSIDFIDWAPAGSDIFNPVTTGIEGNIYGVSSVVPQMAAWALTFVGRTSGGRRGRVAIFGVNDLGTNYRYTALESVVVDAAIAILVANTSFCLGIDGLPVVWHSYADVQVNDHWVKHLR